MVVLKITNRPNANRQKGTPSRHKGTLFCHITYYFYWIFRLDIEMLNVPSRIIEPPLWLSSVSPASIWQTVQNFPAEGRPHDRSVLLVLSPPRCLQPAADVYSRAPSELRTRELAERYRLSACRGYFKVDICYGFKGVRSFILKLDRHFTWKKNKTQCSK